MRRFFVRLALTTVICAAAIGAVAWICNGVASHPPPTEYYMFIGYDREDNTWVLWEPNNGTRRFQLPPEATDAILKEMEPLKYD